MEKKGLDREHIGFAYHKTDYRYVAEYKNGKCREGRLTQEADIVLNECASILQYSRQVFEGLKAYATVDGHIVTFRPDQNARRMAASARYAIW